MVRLTSFLVFALVLSLHSTFAQSAGREKVSQGLQWFALTSNIKMTKRLTLMAEGQFRFADDFDQQQYQARTALDLNLTDHLTIAPLGYVYTWNYRYGKQPAQYENNEHRMFQQIFYKHNLGRLKVDHRLRTEERFIQQHSTMSDGTVVDDGYINKQFRVRYRFMAKLPLNSPTVEPGTYYAAVYDEVFFSWGEKVTYHRADQNRIFAGLGYQFDDRLGVIGGLLHQALVKSNGVMQENNIGFLIHFTYNVDLTEADK